MNSKYAKYVNALFLVAGALVWFLGQHYIEVVIGYFQLGRKMGGGTDVLQHGLPLILGVATFVALRANRQSPPNSLLMRLPKWPKLAGLRLATPVLVPSSLSSR